MKLSEIYKSDKTSVSFEIFPPETTEQIEKLFNEIKILKDFNPVFISLTCGAAGKNNENYKTVLKKLKTDFQIDIMPHFTCMCNKKVFIDDNLEFIKSLGTENIFALRGDIPEDYKEDCHDFCHANELVEYLKMKTDFSIAVAGYPEGHIESNSIEDDIKNLKKKIDAGADVIITQLFFENERFYEFVNRIRDFGITKPVVAGIMPVISLKQLEKMTKLAKITIPQKFLEKIINNQNDKEYIKELGIEFAAEQCRDLLKHKVKGLHFFTLNKAYSTSQILKNIL